MLTVAHCALSSTEKVGDKSGARTISETPNFEEAEPVTKAQLGVVDP